MLTNLTMEVVVIQNLASGRVRLRLVCNDSFVPGDIDISEFNCIEVIMFNWDQTTMLSFVDFINRFKNVDTLYLCDFTSYNDVVDTESFIDIASHIYTKSLFVKRLAFDSIYDTGIAPFFGKTLRTHPFSCIRLRDSASQLSASLYWADNNDRICTLLCSRLERFGKRCAVAKLPVELFRFLYSFLNNM